MKHYLLPFLLCFSGPSFANEQLLGSLRILGLLNNETYIPEQQNQCYEGEPNSNSKDNSNSLALQCAIDMCGVPEAGKYRSNFITDFNFDQYVHDDSMSRFKEIESKLEEMLDAEFAQYDAFVKLLQERLKAGELKPNYSKWRPQDYVNYTFKFFDPYITFESDISKSFNERLSYKIDLPEGASDVFNNGIEQYAKNVKEHITNTFIMSLYNDLYTVDEAKEIFLKKWDEFYIEYKSHRKDNPNFMKEEIHKVERLKLEIENSTFEDLQAIYGNAIELDDLQKTLIYETTDRENHQVFDGNYPCKDQECQKAIQQEITTRYDLENMANEMEKNKDVLKKEMLAYCKSEFALQVVRDHKTSEFLKLIPDIKKALISNVFSKYSNLSQNKLSSYIKNNLHIMPYMDKADQNINFFIDHIERKYEDFKSGSYIQKKDYSNYNFKNYIDEFLHSKSYTIETTPLKTSGLCRGTSPFDVRDHFQYQEMSRKDIIYEQKGFIYISQNSCVNHAYGKNTLAHELGHALSTAFLKGSLSKSSYEKFMELRKCASSLSKKHKNPIHSNNLHKGDHNTTEEDTADLISYLVIPDKSELSKCSSLVPKENGKSYFNVTLDSSDSSIHSATLLRILREAIHKRMNIPASCQELMEQNKDKFRFEPCF